MRNTLTDPRSPFAQALRDVTDKSGAAWGEATKAGRHFYVRLHANGQGEVLDGLPDGFHLDRAHNGVRIGKDLAGRVVVCIPPTFSGLVRGMGGLPGAHANVREHPVDEKAVDDAMLALAEILASSSGPAGANKGARLESAVGGPSALCYIRLDGKGGGDLLENLPAGVKLHTASNGVRLGKTDDGSVVVMIPKTYESLYPRLHHMENVRQQNMDSRLVALGQFLAGSCEWPNANCG